MDDTRRSERDNFGVPPQRFGDPIMTQRKSQKKINKRQLEASTHSLQPLGENEVGEIPIPRSGSFENLSVRSISSTTSSLRQRRRDVDLKAAEDLALLEKQKEEMELEVKKRQLEREAELIKMRQRHEVENIEDELEEQGELDGVGSFQVEDRTESWLQEHHSSALKIAEGQINHGSGHLVKKENGSQPCSENSVEMLANALTKALSKTNTATPSHHLARQTIGRTKLPDFEGDPMEWPTFLAQFKSSTEECKFSKAENLVRLRGCLKKKARESVQALLVSPENMDEIMNTLEANFGRKDLIVWKLINNAKTIASPKENDYNSIMDFSNAVTNMCATMRTFNCRAHLQNPQLLCELLGKLPGNMKYDWSKEVMLHGGEPSLEEFSYWLKMSARALSLLALPSFGNEDKPGKKREATYNCKENENCKCCSKPRHKIGDCRRFKSMDVAARRKIVEEKRLCFICLEAGHRKAACEEKKECGENGCTVLHHPLLHYKRESTFGPQPERTGAEKKEETMSVKEHGSSHLPIIPVVVSGPKGTVTTYALLDEGSTATFIERGLADDLGLEGYKDPLVVNMMKDTVRHEAESRRVKFQLKGDYVQARSFTVVGARTVDNLGIGAQSLEADKLKEKYKYLDGLPIASYTNERPRILVGQTDKLLTLARRYLHKSKVAPVAYKTWLGWVISGTFATANNNERSFAITEDDDLHKLVKNTFELESIGVNLKIQNPRSVEDERAEEILLRTTRRIGDEFETGLLWKNDKIQLPESWNNAFWRLKSQERKMDKDPNFATAMNQKIAEYLDKGFIQKLQHGEVTKSNKEWYLPFFGVYNPNKPGKMRLVFDAAAKSNGVSLNSALLPGPDYLNPLPFVLWKFRQRKIAFGADITDMYHRVKVIKEDLPAQRFLWRGMRRTGLPDVYQINVMIFGAACSPSSAQYVKNKNAAEFEDEFPIASCSVRDLFYVDDYLDGDDNEENAVKKIKHVIEINRRGGFTICKWTSNSKYVIENIPEHLRAPELKEVDISESELPTQRVLGLWWNAEGDNFTFKFGSVKVPEEVSNGKRRPTKREMLCVIMSVFDPLGMISHSTVKAKILMQDVWRAGVEWSEMIPENLCLKWNLWLEELKKLEDVKIPRCYSVQIPQAHSIQLHVFCDASEQAYTSVAYLRVDYGGGVDVSFVNSKNRVAPLKPVSIPRLELQAAVIGSRLATTIVKTLNIEINEVYLWTDSKTVLLWLRSDARKYKQFVAHRIGEILELTSVTQWKWVPTKDNVADDATRDNKPADLSPDSRWFKGPSFLKQKYCSWPSEQWNQSCVEPEDLEMKKEFVGVTIVNQVTNELITRFSSLSRLLRVAAWMRRFVNNSRKTCQRGEDNLNLEEIREALITLIGTSQREFYEGDILELQKSGLVAKTSSVYKLSPYLDQKGILRMRSRLANADFIPEEGRNPVILCGKSRFTKLLIQMYHEDCGHHGRNTVVNNIREKYWITGLGSCVRKCIRECQVCKNLRAKPEIPEMGDLPLARVTPHVRPFTYTGMDFFGPFTVSVGRRVEKRYGVMFSCMTTRAVHLEKADSLSTDSCIMALLRFAAVRGPPQEVFCDNGTNLRATKKELSKPIRSLDKQNIQGRMTKSGIKFCFQPPGGPHFGGHHERLIRFVKVAMGSVIQQTVRDEVLSTVLKQAAYVVNCRPLTEVSVDKEQPVALTPNHFLIGPKFDVDDFKTLEERQDFTDDDLRLRKQWRISQRLVDQFWNRWTKEYLPTLQRRSKWINQVRTMKVDDICVLVDHSAPRNTWPLGRIASVYPGKDGKVRVADILVKGKIYRRPVSKLAALDVN